MNQFAKHVIGNFDARVQRTIQWNRLYRDYCELRAAMEEMELNLIALDKLGLMCAETKVNKEIK